jgi:hypothetical protein
VWTQHTYHYYFISTKFLFVFLRNFQHLFFSVFSSENKKLRSLHIVCIDMKSGGESKKNPTKIKTCISSLCSVKIVQSTFIEKRCTLRPRSFPPHVWENSRELNLFLLCARKKKFTQTQFFFYAHSNNAEQGLREIFTQDSRQRAIVFFNFKNYILN